MNIKQLRILANELRGVGYQGYLLRKDYGAVAEKLNEQEEVPNPVEQPVKPVPITWQEFVGLVTADEALTIYAYEELVQDTKQALDANDRGFLVVLWRILRELLSAESRTAVLAEMQKEQPDPDWSETVFLPSRAQELGLPVVTENDVLRAAQVVA